MKGAGQRRSSLHPVSIQRGRGTFLILFEMRVILGVKV